MMLKKVVSHIITPGDLSSYPNTTFRLLSETTAQKRHSEQH